MAPSVARRDPIAYYPVLLGLAWLAEQYPTTLAERQHDLVVAAEGLIAQNSGFNPIYEGLLGVGVLIFSLVTLRAVLPRLVGYLGVVTGIAAIALPCTRSSGSRTSCGGSSSSSGSSRWLGTWSASLEARSLQGPEADRPSCPLVPWAMVGLY